MGRNFIQKFKWLQFIISKGAFILFVGLMIGVNGNGQTTINSWEDLHNVRNNLSGNYILNVDLNERSPGYDTYASATANVGLGWEPLGNSSSPFIGTFDGNNKTINGLVINRPNLAGVGFFGRTIGATIANLTLANVNITGSHEVGGLIGTNRQGSVTEVNNVHVTGVVTSARTGNNAADCGGLLGYIYDINVINSSTSVVVTAIGRNVGGIVGDGVSNSSLSNCFATGRVTSTGAQGHVGGFAGLYRGNGISNSFSLGSVTRGGTTGSTSVGAGGFIGRLSGSASEITNCYSIGKVTSADAVSTNIGGFVGTGAAVTSTLTNCYWDTDVSNLTDAYGDGTKTGVTGSTTAQMKTQTTFSGWDFSGVWSMSSSLTYNGYPALDYASPVGIAPTTTNEIATLANLLWIAEDNARWNGNYIQTANINAAFVLGWDGNASSSNEYEPRGWSPIGNSTTKFTGSYNGDGHTISNLFINRPNNQRIALFGETDGVSIERLGLVDPDITVTGTGSFGQGSNVGSLVGFAGGTSISQCFASGGSVTAGGSGVGGLIGQLSSSSNLSNSYAIVAVEGGDADQSNFSAGLVGVNSSSTITNCYAAGSVALKQFGGFLTISRGLTQNNGGTITNSFYDSDATGQSTGGGTAKTTLEMQQRATFTDETWDFLCETANGTDDIWGISSNNYPVLTAFGFTDDCSLEWTGAISTAWENAEYWNKPYLPSGLTPVNIPSTPNDPNITTVVNVLSLDVQSSAKVTVAPNYSLSIEGNFNNNGEITLQANSNGEYAQLKFAGTYSGTGTIAQEQHLTGGWHNIAVPVSGNAGMLGEVGTNRHPNAQNLRYWDADAGNWVNVVDNAAPLISGRGYNAFVGPSGVQTATGIITATGAPITSVNPIVEFNINPPAWVDFVDGVEDGWNLVANPFCATLDFTTLTGRTNNVDNSFHIWNPAGDAYVSWANAAPADGVIPPMQSFWVRAQDNSSPSLGTLTYANTTVSTTPTFRKTESISDHVLLRVSEVAQLENADVLTFALTYDNATDGFDNNWDARKMMNPGATPSLYSLGGGEATSINAIPYGPAEVNSKMIPLGMRVQSPTSTAFSIALDDTYLNNHYDIYLEDSKENVFHNLKEGVYRFAYDADAPYRFKLHFGTQGVAIEEGTAAVSAWVFGDGVFIRSNNYEGSMHWLIMDVNGREVQRGSADTPLAIGTTQRFVLPDLSSGIYLLQIVTKNGVQQVKFQQ